MPQTVVSYYQRLAQTHPDQAAFYYQPPAFKNTLTWIEIWTMAQNMAHSLRASGLKPGTRVGILSSTCIEWELTQLAIFLVGGVVVGMDPHDNLHSYEFIINKIGLKHIFVKKEELYEKIFPLKERFQLTFHLMDLEHFKKSQPQEESHEPPGESMAIVLFTSGTHFQPKGIEYTHHQLTLTIETILQTFPDIPSGSRTTCWLPLSNLYQRVINFTCVAFGGSIFFVDKPQDVMKHLKVTNPHVYIGVPRFYEKVYDGVLGNLSKSKLSSTLFYLATIVGNRRSLLLRDNKKPGLVLQIFWNIADQIVFRKIRELFGKNIVFAISGSAPIRKDVLEFFHMIGLTILEAYGTSENLVPIAANRYKQFKFGSVGLPLLKETVKISDEKEILIKGPGLFKGYLDHPSEDCFQDGYYKTSDLGHFDDEGFLYIKGRKSEIFKTATGKKIPSVEIDEVFKSIRYVDVSLTLGENRKAPIVLITLDFPLLASTLNVKIEELWDLEDGNFITRVLDRISQDLLQKNSTVPEKIRPVGFIVLTRKFVLENQELTTNLKIRRRHIESKLTPTLDKIYLEINNNTKTSFWFLNSQDLAMSGSAETKLTVSPIARFFKIMVLLSRVLLTKLSYRLLAKSPSNLYRKLGQIFRDHLGRLRGPLQKIGQMMSYMHEDLPEEFREEVRDLLKDSAPVNSFLIRSIVEKELKKPISLLFAEWSDKPISTASMGQVHWARLHSGEPVAVKVLLPQMDKIAKSDLFLLRLCLPLINNIWKTPSVAAYFFELKNMILAECDFRIEAQNYQIFKKLFAHHPNILIPDIKKDLCSQKVLVTSYVEGMNFEQFLQQADKDSRIKVAETIWCFHCEAINRYAIFNADPHPGNYIISNDKVAIIDFGFCKSWDTQFIDNWKKQTLSGCQGDLDNFVEASLAMGYLSPDKPDFIKNLMKIHQDIFFRPWIADRNFKITHDYLKLYLKTIFEEIVSAGNVRAPVEMLAVIRLYFENFAIMAQLDVELNYYRLTIPYLEERTVGHTLLDKPANTV